MSEENRNANEAGQLERAMNEAPVSSPALQPLQPLQPQQAQPKQPVYSQAQPQRPIYNQAQSQGPQYARPHPPLNTAPLVFTAADKLLLAGALLFGIIFVWLFYCKYPGISVPLMVIAFYSLLFAYTRPVLRKEARFGWFLSLPVLMLSLTFFIFGNETLMVLNILALPVLILLQTILVTGVNSYKWFSPGILPDLFLSAVARSLIHIPKPFGILSTMIRSKTGGGKKSVGSRVLLGLVISVPVLLILLLLLSSADMVFGKIVERLPEFLDTLSFDELLPRMIIALIIFFISFSYIWSLGHGEKFLDNATGLISSKTPDEKRRWDPVIFITITAAIDVLYIFFVIIQFTYLFGRYGLPEGFTYSEYARSGFSELVFVSLLNMGMLALTLTYTKKMNGVVDGIFRLLNSIMICCTFVMLCSAYYRMSLYEDAYGFTFLRIMTQAFMVFLFALFVITMARVWNDRIPLLKPYIAAAVIAFVIINYINVDAMIAQKNVERYHETGNIDIYYFNSLSSSAVEELIELSSDKDPSIAQEAKKILEGRKAWLSDKIEWQSFNLSDNSARKLLLDD